MPMPSKRATTVKMYGWVMKIDPYYPAYSNTKFGEKLTIKTIAVIERGEINIPVYVGNMIITSRKFDLIEEMKSYSGPIPVYFEGKKLKNGQKIYKNNRQNQIEPAQYIMWMFLQRRNFRIEVKEIPRDIVEKFGIVPPIASFHKAHQLKKKLESSASRRPR
jgi:hypothetical protein